MNLLELAGLIGVEGFLHCNELEKLVELAVNRDVLEIGSYRGLSAWGMGMVARSLTCVDTFRAASDGQRQTGSHTTLDAFNLAVRRYNHVKVYSVSSERAIDLVVDDFDMVFVDAMHTYPEVIGDVQRWRPHVRPGGLLVFHDYGHDAFPGVKEAVDECFGPAPDGTVEVTLRWIEIN
jgi:predicted O-methyltransferase YrrM